MKHYDFISVILVYRNADDLEECLISTQAKIPNCRCIVVNAYYDDASMNTIREIAEQYDCDFLNIENKGYSYGNNAGIAFADAHYKYDYVVISNPDIVVREFDPSALSKGDIIAPKITALSGKQQNPMTISRSRISEWLVYRGFRRDSRLLLYAGIAITKLRREAALWVFRRTKRRSRPVYAAHGSFVILSKKTVDALRPVYDENMFLFAEESVLALKAQRAGLKILYSLGIDVLHKEDGSMKFIGKTVNKELKKSNIYFYETYVLKAKPKA